MSENADSKIHAAKVHAAEEAAIAGIPGWLMERLEKAQAEFKAAGGCPGCGCLILGVHTFPCSESANHPFD